MLVACSIQSRQFNVYDDDESEWVEKSSDKRPPEHGLRFVNNNGKKDMQQDRMNNDNRKKTSDRTVLSLKSSGLAL